LSSDTDVSSAEAADAACTACQTAEAASASAAEASLNFSREFLSMLLRRNIHHQIVIRMNKEFARERKRAWNNTSCHQKKKYLVHHPKLV
jgi:hypothetical protein